MAVESYYTDIFKQFGISDKEVFPPEEFLPLVTKYPRIQELKNKVDQKAQLEQSRAYFISRENELPALISAAVSPQKEMLQQELTSITAQKTSITQQIDALTAEITALKAEMGVA